MPHKLSRKERDQAIKVYAQHFHFNGGIRKDLPEFNKVLYENVGIRTRASKVVKLLGY